MSCPDWLRLAAARDADPLVDPPGLAAARAHLADCHDCRKAAARVDPLLLFSALGATDAAAPSRPDPEMQNAVLAMVRASRVAAPASPPRAASGAARWAAGILFAALLGLSGGPPAVDVADPEESAARRADLALAPAIPAELARWIDETAVLSQPVVEEVDRPLARIYDLSRADLAVVMIVDASLDV